MIARSIPPDLSSRPKLKIMAQDSQAQAIRKRKATAKLERLKDAADKTSTKAPKGKKKASAKA